MNESRSKWTLGFVILVFLAVAALVVLSALNLNWASQLSRGVSGIIEMLGELPQDVATIVDTDEQLSAEEIEQAAETGANKALNSLEISKPVAPPSAEEVADEVVSRIEMPDLSGLATGEEVDILQSEIMSLTQAVKELDAVSLAQPTPDVTVDVSGTTVLTRYVVLGEFDTDYNLCVVDNVEILPMDGHAVLDTNGFIYKEGTAGYASTQNGYRCVALSYFEGQMYEGVDPGKPHQIWSYVDASELVTYDEGTQWKVPSNVKPVTFFLDLANGKLVNYISSPEVSEEEALNWPLEIYFFDYQTSEIVKIETTLGSVDKVKWPERVDPIPAGLLPHYKKGESVVKPSAEKPSGEPQSSATATPAPAKPVKEICVSNYTELGLDQTGVTNAKEFDDRCWLILDGWTDKAGGTKAMQVLTVGNLDQIQLATFSVKIIPSTWEIEPYARNEYLNAICDSGFSSVEVFWPSEDQTTVSCK